MKEILVAFDVDGCLITNKSGLGNESLNVPVYQLMVLLSKMKNVSIIVWSGGGQDYAEQVCVKYGLNDFVLRCYGKQEYDDSIYPKVDIAFDDAHEFSMADKNIIVRMK